MTKVKNGRRKGILFAVGIILVVVLCGLTYMFFTKTWLFDNKPTISFSKEPLFTTENYPKFDASTATQPLAIAFMENFTGTKVTDESALDFTKTHQAYEKLINGKVDLILVTSPSDDEKNLATSKGFELEITPVVHEGFVFYVNKNNPIDNLTITQIQDIYSGKITNWNKVGGNDEAIVAYQRPVNSGSQTGMLDLVMKDKPLMQPISGTVQESMSSIVNIVSSYNSNEQNGIGYSYYYYATTMYQDIDASVANNIKFLEIDRVYPDSESIQTGIYPFKTSYYIVMNKNASEDSSVRKLKNAMLSDRGQAVALEANYVPVK